MRRLLAFLLLAAPALAEGPFPEVTEAERSLTEVPGSPGAPAVVLFDRGVLELAPAEDGGSSLVVQTRIKVLSREGLAYGNVEISHSRFHRLRHFAGRTVLRDGTVLPIPDGDVFLGEVSAAEKLYVTRATFPGVEVGAILDTTYTLAWDGAHYFDPWVFQSRIPTLHSQLTYVYDPRKVRVRYSFRETGGLRIQGEREDSQGGTEARVWLEDAPAVAKEPMSPPFADLASRFLLVPAYSWLHLCRDLEDTYAAFRRRDGDAKRLARELVAGAADPHERAARLHAYVRDRVRSAPGDWMYPQAEGADKVLAHHSGTGIEKALLLQTMLAATGQPSGLVWARDRDSGQVDPAVVNPLWFDRFLVEVDLGTDRMVLDPADPRLGFGRLSPRWEGATTLVLRRRGRGKLNVEPLRIRRAPARQNVRRAVLRLELDTEGRLSGFGELHLAGHQAWRRMGWGESPEETSAAWTAWLEGILTGYDVSGLVAAEDLDGARIEVTWKLSQPDGEVLGDEASLLPSLPLGGGEQVFTLLPEHRRNPVAFAFPHLDEVELRLDWPPEWDLDAVPDDVALENPAGRLRASFEVDGPARRLTYRRSFETSQADYTVEEYAALRELYEAARIHDAQELVLSR